ncbi:DUF1993 domain-containing protein [Brevundimonas sp. 2R-24]|uniref:DUF1993 domain-containing protein n=1 Tax=Peiella sedimenti TaxID=3061083 RepID=A0ABT8SK57_9CAUL|nr:DUF1993 domain-containing protein [Caulobacteraceae bacterium XZ-24]
MPTMYEASVPLFLRGLNSLSGLLDKAEPLGERLLDLTLIEDMRPFKAQVQMACFSARACVARLAGVEWPRTADDEASLDDLRATLKLTIDFLESIRPEQLEGAETRAVSMTLPSLTLNFEGWGYLSSFALPNFYFHLSMAYALLRREGVEIGKRDFLGQIALV